MRLPLLSLPIGASCCSRISRDGLQRILSGAASNAIGHRRCHSIRRQRTPHACWPRADRLLAHVCRPANRPRPVFGKHHGSASAQTMVPLVTTVQQLKILKDERTKADAQQERAGLSPLSSATAPTTSPPALGPSSPTSDRANENPYGILLPIIPLAGILLYSHHSHHKEHKRAVALREATDALGAELALMLPTRGGLSILCMDREEEGLRFINFGARKSTVDLSGQNLWAISPSETVPALRRTRAGRPESPTKSNRRCCADVRSSSSVWTSMTRPGNRAASPSRSRL